MKLQCFGHAAVGLTLPDCAILFDPFESGSFGGRLAYPPISFKPDLILVTHDHADHAHTAPFPDAEVIGPEQFTAATGPIQWREQITIRPLRVAHDPFDGRTRGGHSWMLHLTLPDAIGLVHSGDIGELPEQRHLNAWLGEHHVDLLFVACGGYYTLGGVEAAELAKRLNARVTVPFHYKTEGCTLPGLASERSMMSRFARVAYARGERARWDPTTLRQAPYDLLVML